MAVEERKIYEDIAHRTDGDIYIGQLMGGIRFAGFICNINYVVP